MVTNEQMDAFVASKYALFASNELFKNNKANVLQGIQEEISSLTELALPDVCMKRWEFFNITGTRPEDYKERLIEIPGRGSLLVGIRFRGLDVTKPFVSAIPAFIPVETDVNWIGESIREEFRVFCPFAFQMTLPCEHFQKQKSFEEDRYFVAGQIEKILRPNDIADLKIVLVAPPEINFYERYIEEYEVFHKQVSSLKSEVRPEKLEDLNDSLKSDLLYKIMIDGKFAGVISGSESNYHGLKSVSVLEEILFCEFRGKGLGVQIQYEFAKKLKGRFEVLWGTISPKNLPSLRTAIKNNREIIEIDYFFSI